MIPIDSKALNKKPKELRDAIQSGSEVGLKFRGNVYAAVVSIEQREAERTELHTLRQRVAELEAKLEQPQEKAA